MAARGTRNMDAGEEKIGDGDLIRRLRAKSRRIHRRAIITSALITLLTLVFP